METPTNVRKLTTPPAVAMLVTCCMVVATGVISLVFNDPAAVAEAMAEFEGEMRKTSPDFELPDSAGNLLNTGFAVGMLLMALVAGFGAVQMLRLRSWGMSLVAAISMFVPLLWPCCCPFPVGLGIWALVILMREDVRVAMGNRAPTTPDAFTVPPAPTPGDGAKQEPPVSDGDQDGWGSSS